MQVKLSVKHNPAASPGSWSDSSLKLAVRADKKVVEKVEAAIRKALGN